MTELEIELPANFILSNCEKTIEVASAQHSLNMAIKSTLKQFPGCIHWHFKRGKEPGVLEITLWPQEARAWMSVHANRKGAWMDDLIPILKTTIERSFHAH